MPRKVFEELCRAKSHLTKDDISISFSRDWWGDSYYYGVSIKLITKTPYLWLFTKKEEHQIVYAFRSGEDQVFVSYNGFEELVPLVRDMTQEMITSWTESMKKLRLDREFKDAQERESKRLIAERYLNER